MSEERDSKLPWHHESTTPASREKAKIFDIFFILPTFVNRRDANYPRPVSVKLCLPSLKFFRLFPPVLRYQTLKFVFFCLFPASEMTFSLKKVLNFQSDESLNRKVPLCIKVTEFYFDIDDSPVNSKLWSLEEDRGHEM